MSQSELCRRTNIRPQAINDMYHELSDRVNLDYIDRICEVLDCELTDLLEYIPNEIKERWKIDK